MKDKEINFSFDLDRKCYYYLDENKLLLKTVKGQYITLTWEINSKDFIQKFLKNIKNIEYIKFRA